MLRLLESQLQSNENTTAKAIETLRKPEKKNRHSITYVPNAERQFPCPAFALDFGPSS
jgi:hypothetical protein